MGKRSSAVPSALALTNRKKVRASSALSRSSNGDQDREGSNAEWAGAPVYKSEGDTYYEKAIISGVSVRVGDFVKVLIEDEKGSQALCVAVVESMWEGHRKSSPGSINTECRASGRFFEARWFKAPSEVSLAPSTKRSFADGELLETDELDECSLDAVDHKVQVLTRAVFTELKRARSGKSAQYDSDSESGCDDGGNGMRGARQDLYFCEWFFYRELRQLRPTQLFVRRRESYIYSPRLRLSDFKSANNELLAEIELDSQGNKSSNHDIYRAGMHNQATSSQVIERATRIEDGRNNINGEPRGYSGQGVSERKEILNTDPFQRAQRLLQLSAVPPSLPCRENERKTVMDTLKDGLERGGGSLYISGMPGTGKTATVHEVVRSLRADAALGKIDRFDFVEVNGMRLRHPYDAYSEIYRGLTGKHLSCQRAGQLLAQMFNEEGSNNDNAAGSPNKRVCILLVDEMDYMVTRKQTVLYNLFDWPLRPNSWLVTVGIANTMDLPERLLPRINSRITARQVFKSYTSAQLETILCSRMRGLEVFEEGAITLCSKKVASVSGDIRRALAICREAIQVCVERKGKEVTMQHVQAASKAVQNSPVKLALKSLPLLEKIICVALCRRLDMQEKEDSVDFAALTRTVQMLWKDHGALSRTGADAALAKHIYMPLTRTELLAGCHSLGLTQLINLTQDADDRVPTLKLGQEITSFDVVEALENDKECASFFASN